MSLQILRKGENEMAKKEVKTDLWVARQLDDSKIKYDAQGSDVKEINDALQSASKRGTGNAGYPEYVAVVKDFVIVIEDKADLTKHQKLSNTGILSVDQKDIADYAVNGAYDFLGRGGAGSSVLLLRSAYNELLSGQFIARMISQTCSKYTYGHMGNKESIKREIIQLPTTDEYKPDYQYMASYSNQKRLALLEKYRVYAKTRIAELGEPMEIPAITQKKWEPVLVSDIFDILSGKRLVAADTTPGDRPFIGALDNSNGIARFVNDTNVSLDKNVLGVNYDGNGMVIGFYHPYECIFSDSVKRFHLKNHEDKAFVLL